MIDDTVEISDEIVIVVQNDDDGEVLTLDMNDVLDEVNNE